MANWKDIRRTARVKARYAALHLKEKNRRAAAANRLRTVIRCEESAAEKEYLALGRYYYNALRSRDNAIAEAHCARIDAIQARRDSALEGLEQIVREQEDAGAAGVFEQDDGPTAVLLTEKKRGALFHLDRGPVEITVTRDEGGEYDPEDEDSEEVDLSDVEVFGQDPMPDGPAPQAAEAEPRPLRAAELDENDGLPFE